MASAAIRSLADALLAQDSGLPVKMLWGQVIAIVTGPPKTLTITVGGSSTQIPGVRYAASYTPTVGDTVYGRIVGTDYLVEGKLA